MFSARLPSSEAGEGIYDLFDKVMVLDHGRQVYSSPPSEARPCSEDLGFRCLPGRVHLIISFDARSLSHAPPSRGGKFCDLIQRPRTRHPHPWRFGGGARLGVFRG